MRCLRCEDRRRPAAAHSCRRTAKEVEAASRTRAGAHRVAARHGLLDALVSGARHPCHRGGTARHRRRGSRRVRLHQHRGESRRRVLRHRPIHEVGRTPLRRLRQPIDGMPGRGAALAGIPAAAAQEAPRRARRPRRAACGHPLVARRAGTARRRSASRSGSSRWAAAPTGWCSTAPTRAWRARATALDHLLFAGGSAAIRDVMVAGRWVIKDGQHGAEAPLAGAFRV